MPTRRGRVAPLASNDAVPPAPLIHCRNVVTHAVSPLCQPSANTDTGIAFIDLSRGVDERQQRVSARALHTFLGSGRTYTAWWETRAAEADLIEGEDFEVYDKSVKNPRAGGRPTVDHWLSLPAAKLLAILERNDRGK